MFEIDTTQIEGVQTRSMQVRAVDSGSRTFTGIAVPYNSPTDIGGWYTEQFAPGSVRDSDDALVFYLHSEPIGRITEARDTAEGWLITGTISETPRGDEAYTLLRDGVLRSLSVGFRSLEYTIDDESGTVTRTAVQVAEVSVVPFPAYAGATITEVRNSHHHTTPDKEETVMTDQITQPPAAPTAELDGLRARFEDLDRGIESRFAALADAASEPARDNRSAGEILQALVRGDESTIASYDALMQRAFNGAVIADAAPLPQWVGDLTRLIADSSILPGLFETGTLPSTGNVLEYGQLKSNTVDVGEQVNEGDDLSFGKVAIENKTAPVKTYGGYTTLTRQAVERSSVQLLDTHLAALALAAAKRRNISLRAFLATVRAGQVTADTKASRTTVTVGDASDYLEWVSAIVDAAGFFEDLALPLDGLLADRSTFKTLAGLHDLSGRPLMTVYGSGTNVVGEVNVAAITGNLAGVTVRVDSRQTAPGASFFNKSAIRQYNSPVVSLTDSNVVNLTNAYSVYFYAALAAEIPGAVVPVVSADPTAA